MVHQPISSLKISIWYLENNSYKSYTSSTYCQVILGHIISNRTLLNTSLRYIIMSQTLLFIRLVLLYVFGYMIFWFGLSTLTTCINMHMGAVFLMRLTLVSHPTLVSLFDTHYGTISTIMVQRIIIPEERIKFSVSWSHIINLSWRSS